MILLLDTGGVRLQEANAGEVGVAEIVRAVVEARVAGIQVIGLIGGRAGCFGGGSLIAAACSTLIVSEHARIGVTGPEVIETNHGAEEFDSTDRALVWRTTGGKHRYLTGGADLFVDDRADAFRFAALSVLGRVTRLSLDELRHEHRRLEDRLARFGHETDAFGIWRALGIRDAAAVTELSTGEFQGLAAHCRISADGTR